MISLINYSSGEMIIDDGRATPVRLGRDAANRVIMTARMHGVDEFLQKLPSLIPDEALLATLTAAFEGKDNTARWNLKEKFARLVTLAKGYTPADPSQVLDQVRL